MRELYRYDRVEFTLCVLTMLGVASFGMIKAILVAVVLSILRFVQLVARPTVDRLGKTVNAPEFHSMAEHPDAEEEPGMVLIRFEGPVVFFNAEFFKQQILGVARRGVRMIVLDAYPITRVDSTGYQALRELASRLNLQGIQLAVAGRRDWIRRQLAKRSVTPTELNIRFFTSFEKAVESFRNRPESRD
jgi:MFS superfamily sulfate permease-like transporter